MSLKKQIEEFLDSEEEIISIDMQPINDIGCIIQELGYKYDDTDINGWQIDFWYYYKHKENSNKISIIGSLYYGDFKLKKEKDV